MRRETTIGEFTASAAAAASTEAQRRSREMCRGRPQARTCVQRISLQYLVVFKELHGVVIVGRVVGGSSTSDRSANGHHELPTSCSSPKCSPLSEAAHAAIYVATKGQAFCECVFRPLYPETNHERRTSWSSRSLQGWWKDDSLPVEVGCHTGVESIEKSLEFAVWISQRFISFRVQIQRSKWKY
jgi:hypothetical protein